ncbi:unnamed protein product [Kluyveromyces dobzhanskii CBS 2104]|uniref:WGS project CCBQ000000000 data, contig 00099 n=1 Tax=Kluyveromyces dobzhanskii CBS 2104 TaxID=1427455 RepID=A0A0A8L4W5_9SACH|nr:unnamed protein product [Kluyveromyces dobzhanskii CBS 2104]
MSNSRHKSFPVTVNLSFARRDSNIEERFYAPSKPDMVVLRKLGYKHFGIMNIFESHFVGAKLNKDEMTEKHLRTFKDLVDIWEDFLTVGTLYLNIAKEDSSKAMVSKSTAEAVQPAIESEEKLSIPSAQWEKLIKSLEKLELSIRGNNDAESSAYDVVHDGIICDGCQDINNGSRIVNTKTADESGFIKGPRFTCLYCHDYDLCGECESKGFESGTHKTYHNFVKTNTPDSKLKTFVYEYLQSNKKDSKRQSRYNQVPAPSRYNQVPPAPRYNQVSHPCRYGPGLHPQEIKTEGFYGCNKHSAKDFSPKEPPAYTSQDLKDVVVKVGLQNRQVISDFFSEIKTESQLEQLMQDAISWRIAKQWYGEDIYEKLEKYECLMKENAKKECMMKEVADKEHASGHSDVSTTEVKKPSNSSLRVEMFQKGHLLTFKLFNDGDETIPNGLRLVFQCEQKGRVSTPIKCNLQVGPDELQPGNYKILNFNYRYSLEQFSFEHPCKIDLIDTREQVVYTTDGNTHCGSSIFYLKPPTLKANPIPSFRDVPCNEEHEGSDGQYAPANSSHSDTDVISSSVTDQEDEEDNDEEQDAEFADQENNDLVYVESLSEEYDLLSDSDFEQS